MRSEELNADKGLKNGSCNRTACQKPGANFFNRSTKAYYCADCAKMINSFMDTRKYCEETFGNPDLCVQDDGDVDLRFQRINMASLAKNTVARLNFLARSVDNWDGEGAKAMTLLSLENFIDFLVKVSYLSEKIGIFLDFNGHIEASWPLKSGDTLDISFGDTNIELATDQHDEVFSIGDNRIYKLIDGLYQNS